MARRRGFLTEEWAVNWRILNSVLVLGIWAAVPSPAVAQSDYHHMHLTVTDAEDAAQWYVTHMGCDPVEGRADRALCDSTYFFFFARDPEGPSAGTGVNHIGFSFDNLDAKAASLEASGISLEGDGVRDVPNLFKIAFLTDPWGTRIELVEHDGFDGFHHVHLSSPNPSETLAWYQEMFGGERTRMQNMIDGMLYGGEVWLLVSQAREDVAPTEGRAVDHLGFSFPNLDSAAAELKQKGVSFTVEPREIESPTSRKISFVTGPDNVRIEVVEPR